MFSECASACSLPGSVERARIRSDSCLGRCPGLEQAVKLANADLTSIENLRADLHRIKDALGSKKVDLYEVSSFESNRRQSLIPESPLEWTRS